MAIAGSTDLAKSAKALLWGTLSAKVFWHGSFCTFCALIRRCDPPSDSYCPGPVVEHRLRVMVSDVLLSLYSDACRQLWVIRDPWELR